MQATIELVSDYVRQHVRQLALTPTASLPCLPVSFPPALSNAWLRRVRSVLANRFGHWPNAFVLRYSSRAGHWPTWHRPHRTNSNVADTVIKAAFYMIIRS